MSNKTKDKPQKRDGRTAFSLVERFQLQMILANWLKGDVLTVDVGTALKLKLSITASDMTKHCHHQQWWHRVARNGRGTGHQADQSRAGRTRSHREVPAADEYERRTDPEPTGSL